MKTIKFFAATACALFLSTAAFAQTTPGGTMQGGTMQNGTPSTGTMNNGTMTTSPQTGTGTDRMNNGTMNNGTMNGRTNGKAKMNSSKGTRKTKMSTTPSSTGTM